MRILLLTVLLFSFMAAPAQEERDTVLNRCPVYITDTATANNFFLEFQKTTLKVYRNQGNLTIGFQQKDQFFTVFFKEKKLRNGKYAIVSGERGKMEVNAKYSFMSGEQVSYVDVSRGTMESAFDKEKNLWHIKLTGQIANSVGRTVSYFKVRADFWIK